MNLNEYVISLNNVNESIDIVKERLSAYITNDDLVRYFGNDINNQILKYSELSQFKHIEEILPHDKSYKIILIEEKLNSGHWVLIMRYGEHIEFFNSYGLKPSAELDFLSCLRNCFLGQNTKHLNILLDKARSRFKIIYNKKKFQKVKNGINTCGRWIILRIIMMCFFGMDLYSFIHFMEKLKKQYKLPFDVLAAMIVI